MSIDLCYKRVEIEKKGSYQSLIGSVDDSFHGPEILKYHEHLLVHKSLKLNVSLNRTDSDSGWGGEAIVIYDS
ncbi:hypothetical protein J6590_081578 [Homalodisca vitripennis]|nr:hypothetical protein J6590_081578 [Homalodisca vitripennis]